MKEINYLFDVDGTLTPSRGVIDSEFKKWFINFASVKNVILVTGSDRDKTLEQLGESIYKKCKRVYNCSGNDVYEQDKQIKFNDWKLPIDAQQWLQFNCVQELFVSDRSVLFNCNTPLDLTHLRCREK